MYDIIFRPMTTKEIKKIEKMASESAKYARKAMAKSNELYAVLSVLEAKSGKVKRFTSASSLFKRLKV